MALTALPDGRTSCPTGGMGSSLLLKSHMGIGGVYLHFGFCFVVSVFICECLVLFFIFLKHFSFETNTRSLVCQPLTWQIQQSKELE